MLATGAAACLACSDGWCTATPLTYKISWAIFSLSALDLSGTACCWVSTAGLTRVVLQMGMRLWVSEGACSDCDCVLRAVCSKVLVCWCALHRVLCVCIVTCASGFAIDGPVGAADTRELSA